ncbi:hypothetical protein [Aphanizomenon flos-aquae]|uniref:hypothetical protein n=1 Tax=Aphanizomenon flos-aquae TaxID=1176 RepID=UPI0028809299|nr:hypothetical protein [Aphanizomenon flos-aquae]
MENSLNKLQIRLQDYLISVAMMTSSPITTETELFQIMVNELHKALNNHLITFTQSIVCIAIFEQQQTVGKISYISDSLLLTPTVEIIPAIAEMLNVVTKLYIFKYTSIIKGKNVNIS